jgi:hypothetical protein
MRRPPVFLLIAVVAGIASRPAPAHACGFAGPTPHTIDPAMQAIDQVPPTLPPIPPPQITRGKAPEWSGCGQTASSCDDVGTVGLQVQATDDVTAPGKIGYRLTLMGGSLPEGLALPGAIEPYANALVLIWSDGRTDDQEDIDFTLSVVAIDLAGNESAPQTVRVSDHPGFGCAVARPRSGRDALACLVVAAAILAARRRRTP